MAAPFEIAGAPRAAPTLTHHGSGRARDASELPLAAGVDLLNLLLGPGDGLVDRHLARRVLREHVGDDEEVEDLLGRRRGGTGPGRWDRHLGDLGDVPV